MLGKMPQHMHKLRQYWPLRSSNPLEQVRLPFSVGHIMETQNLLSNKILPNVAWACSNVFLSFRKTEYPVLHLMLWLIKNNKFNLFLTHTKANSKCFLGSYFLNFIFIYLLNYVLKYAHTHTYYLHIFWVM